MYRKEFLDKVIKSGLVPAFLLTYARGGRAQTESAENDNPQQKFTGQWIVSLMQNINSNLSEQDKQKLLESCGRDCAKHGAVEMAKANQGNVKGLLTTLAEHLGNENAVMEGNKATIKYSKCYCPNLANFSGTMPAIYCTCSKGWVLEMFEIAAQKPVKVELLHSIVRGDDHCEFTIEI